MSHQFNPTQAVRVRVRQQGRNVKRDAGREVERKTRR
jgi:hypothetical protein